MCRCSSASRVARAQRRRPGDGALCRARGCRDAGCRERGSRAGEAECRGGRARGGRHTRGRPALEILRRFAREQPNADVALRTATSAEVSELRAARRSDHRPALRSRPVARPRLRGDRNGAAARCLRRRSCAGRPPRARSWQSCAISAGSRFPEVPGRREIGATHIRALFQTHGLGDVHWTPVDSLTAQKRLVEAGFGLALFSENHAAEETRGRIARDHPRRRPRRQRRKSSRSPAAAASSAQRRAGCWNCCGPDTAPARPAQARDDGRMSPAGSTPPVRCAAFVGGCGRTPGGGARIRLDECRLGLADDEGHRQRAAARTTSACGNRWHRR